MNDSVNCLLSLDGVKCMALSNLLIYFVFIGAHILHAGMMVYMKILLIILFSWCTFITAQGTV